MLVIVFHRGWAFLFSNVNGLVVLGALWLGSPCPKKKAIHQGAKCWLRYVIVVREYVTTIQWWQREKISSRRLVASVYSPFKKTLSLAYTERPEMLHRFSIFPKNILGHILNTWGANRLIGTWASLTRFTSTPSYSLIHLFIIGPQGIGLSAWFSTVAPLSCTSVTVPAPQPGRWGVVGVSEVVVSLDWVSWYKTWLLSALPPSYHPLTIS